MSFMAVSARSLAAPALGASRRLVRWHPAGFRCYWRWKSLRRGGRPQIETALRALIRRMSIENRHLRARRASMANCSSSASPSLNQASRSTWSSDVDRLRPGTAITFLHNHAPDIAAVDLFVVPTIGFKLLYAFVVVRLNRRDLVWIIVTTNANAEWVARQRTKHSPGTRLRATCSGTVIGFTLPSSYADYVPWASGTSLLHWPHPGRMAVPNG